MLANNQQRLDVWLNTANKFDYAEFAQACVLADCSPQQPLEFAQKVGMLMVAQVAYPDLQPAEAYQTFVRNNSQQDVPVVALTKADIKPSCCGGGVVR